MRESFLARCVAADGGCCERRAVIRHGTADDLVPLWFAARGLGLNRDLHRGLDAFGTAARQMDVVESGGNQSARRRSMSLRRSVVSHGGTTYVVDLVAS